MVDSVTRAVGARIAELREAKGVSRPDFARSVGFAPTFQGRVERGLQNLSLSTMVRIAVELEVELADLVAGVPLPTKGDA